MKYPRQIDIHFTRQSDEAAGPYGDVFNCRVASAVKHSLPEDLREKFVSAGTNAFMLGTVDQDGQTLLDRAEYKFPGEDFNRAFRAYEGPEGCHKIDPDRAEHFSTRAFREDFEG